MADLQFIIKILTEEVGGAKADQIIKRITAAEKELEVQAKKSAAAVAEVGNATKQTGNAAKPVEELASGLDKAATKVKAFKGHGEELRKIIGQLSNEFPIAGAALRLFVNPVGGALAVGVGLFVAIKRHIADLNTQLDELEANARQPLSNFAEALREVQTAAASVKITDAFKDFGKQIENISTNAQTAVNSIRALEVAQKELTSAKEAEALAAVNFSEQEFQTSGGKRGLAPALAVQKRQAVRDYYAQQQKQIGDTARDKEISVREAEAAKLAATLGATQANVLTDPQVEKAKVLIQTRTEQAAKFKEFGTTAKFDKDGNLGSKGKTLDEQLVESNAEVDAHRATLNQWRSMATSRHGQTDPKFKRTLQQLETDYDTKLSQRDALMTRQKNFANDARSSEAEAESARRSVQFSEESKTKVAELQTSLDRKNAELQALREARGISQTTGAKTDAIKRSTAETETNQATIAALQQSGFANPAAGARALRLAGFADRQLAGQRLRPEESAELTGAARAVSGNSAKLQSETIKMISTANDNMEALLMVVQKLKADQDLQAKKIENIRQRN